MVKEARISVINLYKKGHKTKAISKLLKMPVRTMYDAIKRYKETGGCKTPLVFVDKGLKINAITYQQRILRDVLYPCARQHFEKNKWILQQDQSTMRMCKELLSEVWDRTICRSNSPDLNTMDYSVWSILERKISSKKYTTVEQLKSALERAWNQITTEECAIIASNFKKRLRACVKAKGEHFEYLL
ncbi:PREDICTED: uncharacterized protein LOC107186816 [Dufourea novaeangliae]|uniref:uncharacterized protein LOC107186816 n=1 Tax=Dufourea novaeangliae TaxID=178035 RepID=UPI000767BF1F|nr:PREDICTED: uncharacterized protein LOC107186816 [Dufourea novaeangliae]